MKLIPLNRKDGIKMDAMVDDEDYDYLIKWKWYAGKSSYNKDVYYVFGYKDNRIVPMHRLIMNAQKGQLVDHKDRNTLNNQKSNLRICTREQNGANRRSFGVSKYLGVTYNKHARKFTVRIRANKKYIHVGTFVNELDAARAYNKKAIEIHGEFANLNVL